jgi:hypothetical protein
MDIRSPELTTTQIASWMRLAATLPPERQTARRAPADMTSFRNHPGFDFKKARQALNRARAKTSVKMIQPFRRIRRNQGAVNEALIDSFGALVAVNKQMAAEITALSAELGALRQRFVENETPSASDSTTGQS